MLSNPTHSNFLRRKQQAWDGDFKSEKTSEILSKVYAQNKN